MILERIINLPKDSSDTTARVLKREWLVTNGMGGYASGTISGRVSRRYHSLLVAAMPEPLGRVVMLNHLAERVQCPSQEMVLVGGPQPVRPGDVTDAPHYLQGFKLEDGMPVWQHEVGGTVIEKRLFLAHGQNTVFVSYNLLAGPEPVLLDLSPGVNFRHHESAVNQSLDTRYALQVMEDRYEIRGEGYPALRLHLPGQRVSFQYRPDRLLQIGYLAEAERGYASTGPLWSPGSFQLELRLNQPAVLVASTEEWDAIEALSPADAQGAFVERRRKLVAAAHAAVQSGVGRRPVYHPASRSRQGRCAGQS
jgi:predicted glycogen debranching enzyme